MLVGIGLLSMWLTGCRQPAPLTGAELYQRLNCWACHERELQGQPQAPTLANLGARLPSAALEMQLTAPRQRRSSSRMPSFAFVPPAERRVLIDYLRQRR